MNICKKLRHQFIGLAIGAALLGGCDSGDENYVFTNTPPQPATPSARDPKEGFSNDAGTLSGLPNVAPDQSAGRLLAMYVVGSDLESRGGAGTTDFNELITGLQRLTPTQRDSLSLIIAFGGANKAGWRGMKWMTTNQLLQDAADGVYGNETAPGAYLYQADGANMGHPSSLTQYLGFVAQHFPNKSERFVVFWDHGGSYDGFGNDENFNMRPLKLPEIAQSLAASGLPKIDLLGFDACLMASMETVRYVAPYAKEMVASEELEPGHGWDYRYVGAAMANSPDMTSLATGLVDNFVDSANHPYPADGKTLSVLSLDQAPAALAAMDQYAFAYAAGVRSNDFSNALVQAVTAAREFGAGGEGRTAVDLIDFVSRTTVTSNGGLPAGALVSQLQSFVLYSKEDGTRPGSQGVSIVPPDKNASRLTAADFASQAWQDLANAALALIAADNQAPRVLDIRQSPQGLLVSFADALLTEVRTIYGVDANADGTLSVIADFPANPTAIGNQWLAPVWDRQWFGVRSGSNGPVSTLPLSLVDSRLQDGAQVRVYQTRVDYVDASANYSGNAQPFDTAYLELVVNDANQVIDHEVKPFIIQYENEQDTTGEVVFERTTKKLKAGDRLQLYAATLQVGEQLQEGMEKLGAEIVFSEPAQFVFGPVQGLGDHPLVYGVAGEDFAGKTSLSTLVEAP